MRWNFFGSNGLRAGWRLLRFVVLVVAVLAALRAVLERAVPAGMQLGLHRLADGVADPVELGAFEAAVLAAILLATAISAMLERRGFASYGLPWRLLLGRQFWTGALWGFAAISAVVAVLLLCGAARVVGVRHGVPVAGDALLWSAVAIVIGLAEESTFRGYLQATLASGIGFWPAAAVISLIFAGYHVTNAGESPIGLASIVVFGLFFCLALRRTGNLWWPIGFHAAWDWGQSFFYGVADSGLSASRNLLTTVPDGPSWLSGGGVGPEASILCPVVLLACGAALVGRRGPVARASERAAAPTPKTF